MLLTTTPRCPLPHHSNHVSHWHPHRPLADSLSWTGNQKVKGVLFHYRQSLLDTQNKEARSHCRSSLCFTFVQPLSSLSLSTGRGQKNCIGILVMNQNLCKKGYNQYTWHKTDMMPWNWGNICKTNTNHFLRSHITLQQDGWVYSPLQPQQGGNLQWWMITRRLSSLKEGYYAVLPPLLTALTCRDSALPIISKNAHI